MLTLFAVPKPFHGHVETIQRNAIQSWALLRPRPEIILLGREEGTAEVAEEFGVWHVPQVTCNEYGTPLVSSLFEVAQAISKTSLMAYVNADIILMRDFMAAISRFSLEKFLMVGERWDIDLKNAIHFDNADWEAQLCTHVREAGRLHGRVGIDYFVFPHGLYQNLPRFAVGRPAWDNWLIFRTWSLGIPVIDATSAITAIHQNHDYSHIRQGEEGIRKGPEARQNMDLAGDWRHIFTLQDANWILTSEGLARPKLTKVLLYRKLDILAVLRPSLEPWVRLVKYFLTPLSLVGGIFNKMK